MEKKKRNNAYANILKYTSLFGGVQALSILVALVRNKLVAVLLGPMGMGLLSLFNSDTFHWRLYQPWHWHECRETHFRGLCPRRRANNKPDRANRKGMECHHRFIRHAGMCLAQPLLSKYTFGWGKHTLHFLLLSPVVAMTAIMGGELAILKGTRHLGGLARISIINVALAVVLSVPLFFVWRAKAIVPSMIIVAFAQMIITMAYSYHYQPLNLHISASALRNGGNMVRLGIGFFSRQRSAVVPTSSSARLSTTRGRPTRSDCSTPAT